MAIQKIIMPQMGESITTGTITCWYKKVGDEIKEDETLLDISTDKVESEIPSPFSGRISKLLFADGATVDVGAVIAEVEDDMSAELSNTVTEDSTPIRKIESKSVAITEDIKVEKTKYFFTPLVKALAKKAKVSMEELSTIKGSGAAGRVNKKDFENFLANRKGSLTPSAKNYSNPPLVFSGKTEIIPMDNMRKAIAYNMVASKQISAHVNSISEVDMTHLVKFREGFKDEFFRQEGFKLTYTPFILKAVIEALKEYPLVNSSIDGDNIIVKKEINLGFAAAVPGNGLTVPVIHNAESFSLLGICRKLDELANKARSKKLTLDDLQGGTFSCTNVGGFGTLLATPIILQPQVGIYAVGMIKKRVMVMPDDSMAIRSMMYGTHTYDHRVIDGQLGGLFLEAIHRNLLEMNPNDHF